MRTAETLLKGTEHKDLVKSQVQGTKVKGKKEEGKAGWKEGDERSSCNRNIPFPTGRGSGKHWEAIEVTQLGLRHMISIPKQVMISGGKETTFMPGETFRKEGGSARAASDTFSRP